MKTSHWLAGALIAPAILVVSAHAEKVTYLGVATVPLNPVAAYQLDLPEGVGLAIVQVADDGVVKDKLVPNDVLHKLDDQILTSPEQLAVLVRGHKSGDAIKLTVFRKGKAETLKVQLGTTDARNVAAPAYRHGWPMGNDDDRSMPDPQQYWEQLQRQWQNRWQGDNGDNGNDDATTPAPRTRNQGSRTHNNKESHSTSVVTETRDGLTVTLTDRDGKKTVKAEDNGKVLADDLPINTAEQIKALPEKVRDRVNALQKQFKTENQPAPLPRSHGPNIAL